MINCFLFFFVGMLLGWVVAVVSVILDDIGSGRLKWR